MIISDKNILKRHLNDLKKTFQKRGYPLSIINTEINKVKQITQKQLLCGNHKKGKYHKNKAKKTQTKTLPFITPYSEHFKSIDKVLTKHWEIIKSDPLLRDTFPNKPFVSYTRHKNLKDILISSKFLGET